MLSYNEDSFHSVALKGHANINVKTDLSLLSKPAEGSIQNQADSTLSKAAEGSPSKPAEGSPSKPAEGSLNGKCTNKSNRSESIQVAEFIAELYNNASNGQNALFDFICEALSCRKVEMSVYSSNPSEGDELSDPKSETVAIHDATLSLKTRFKNQILVVHCVFASESRAKELVRSNFMNAVRCHIQRAARIACRILQLEQRAMIHAGLLDQLRLPAVAVNRGYRVVKRNALARKALLHEETMTKESMTKESMTKEALSEKIQCEDVVNVGPNGVLKSLFSRQTMADDCVLVECIDRAFRGVTSYHRVKNSDSKAADSLLLVQAMEPASACTDYSERNKPSDQLVWMFLVAIDFTSTLKSNPLFLQLGLTLKERQLVEALFSGLALKEVATERRVSRDTLRKQLSSVFKKTGSDSQEGLMLMLYKRCIYPMLMQPTVMSHSI